MGDTPGVKAVNTRGDEKRPCFETFQKEAAQEQAIAEQYQSASLEVEDRKTDPIIIG